MHGDQSEQASQRPIVKRDTFLCLFPEAGFQRARVVLLFVRISSTVVYCAVPNMQRSQYCSAFGKGLIIHATEDMDLPKCSILSRFVSSKSCSWCVVWLSSEASLALG